MPLPRRPKPEKTKQRKISTPGPSSNGNGLRKRKLSIRGLFGPSRGADATEHAERWGKTVKNGDGKKESMGDAGAAMVKQLAQYRAAKEAAQAQVAANQYGQGGHEPNPEFTVGSLLYRFVKPPIRLRLRRFGSSDPSPLSLRELQRLTLKWLTNHYRLSTELEGVDDVQQRRMIIDEILKKSPPELQFPTQQSEVQPEQHARQMRSNMTLEERFHKEGIEPDLDGLIEEFNRLSAIEQIANNLQHMRNMA
ncbi:hypothetical protein BT69DRAFT_1278341 [Atractiella rhizophila]|nr:hypothetical protein BT69DRAFT_1278341 [Atractiella rhizophila]